MTATDRHTLTTLIRTLEMGVTATQAATSLVASGLDAVATGLRTFRESLTTFPEDVPSGRRDPERSH